MKNEKNEKTGERKTDVCSPVFVLFLILFIDFPQYSAGSAGGYHVGRDIPGYNAVSADHRIFPMVIPGMIKAPPPIHTLSSM